MPNIFVSVLQSIVGAIIFYASSSYIKRSTSNEPFSPEKMFLTVTIGAVVGVLAYLFNLEFEPATQMLFSTGAVVAIETWLKAVYRKWIQPHFTVT